MAIYGNNDSNEKEERVHMLILCVMAVGGTVLPQQTQMATASVSVTTQPSLTPPPTFNASKQTAPC